jgi:hypothetical protein
MNKRVEGTFDRLDVWTRLELAIYVASHDGKNWPGETDHSAEALGDDQKLVNDAKPPMGPIFRQLP